MAKLKGIVREVTGGVDKDGNKIVKYKFPDGTETFGVTYGSTSKRSSQ